MSALMKVDDGRDNLPMERHVTHYTSSDTSDASAPDPPPPPLAARHTLWTLAVQRCSTPHGEPDIPYQARIPDSPLLEMIWRGRANDDAMPLCPADALWYLRFLRRGSTTSLEIHGPTTQAAGVPYRRDDAFLGIRFKLGVFMPHLPPRAFVNGAITLAESVERRFWLHGTTYETPTYDNADDFIDRLLRADLLAYDPIVRAVLRREPLIRTPQRVQRTAHSVQQHVAYARGLTQRSIRQIERARAAGALLERGATISDVVAAAGYCDQAHLTRSLTRLLGRTPAQITRAHRLPE
jgi:AraC-like DNA-binding protein